MSPLLIENAQVNHISDVKKSNKFNRILIDQKINQTLFND